MNDKRLIFWEEPIEWNVSLKNDIFVEYSRKELKEEKLDLKYKTVLTIHRMPKKFERLINCAHNCISVA